MDGGVWYAVTAFITGGFGLAIAVIQRRRKNGEVAHDRPYATNAKAVSARLDAVDARLHTCEAVLRKLVALVERLAVDPPCNGSAPHAVPRGPGGDSGPERSP